MPGAGFSPAGFSPAGFGSPATAPAPGGAVYQDVSTGAQQSGRFVHPTTGQYIYTQYGRIAGQATAAQLVQLALTTVLGSSADPTTGHTLSEIRDIGGDYAQQVTARVQRALAPYVAQKIIAILSITLAPLPTGNPNGARNQVKWRDLTTGIEQTTNF